MHSSSVIGLFLFVGGCAAIRNLDEYSIVDGVGASANDTVVHTSSIDASAGCTTHRSCNTEGGTTPAICVKTTGTCVPLTTPECPRVLGDPMNDDAVFVGTLLGTSAAATSDAERAAFMAAAELATAPAAIPKLVVIGCDVAGDALVPARHLVDDLHVSAMLGPGRAEDVVAVTQQVSAPGGTLLMTDSPATSIANLADEDLTWRDVSSDAQRAKLVIEQMNELETLLRATRALATVKLAIVNADDALGTSARDAITGKLILNGHFVLDAANAAYVSVDGYGAGDATAAGAIATAYARDFRPDIVFLTSADQIASVMLPLERSLAAARITDHPYYVLTDPAKTGDLLARIDSGDLPSDIRRRIRGVGPVAGAASAPALADFTSAFTARYGAAPAVSAGASYDAMYAVAYAVATTTDLPAGGPRVGHGLRSLAVGNPAFVGAKAIADISSQLVQKQSVSLSGTSGPLQWDASGDLRGGSLEVWCVGARDGAAVYGSSGMTMDVQTQVVGGAYVQCQ